MRIKTIKNDPKWINDLGQFEAVAVSESVGEVRMGTLKNVKKTAKKMFEAGMIDVVIYTR